MKQFQRLSIAFTFSLFLVPLILMAQSTTQAPKADAPPPHMHGRMGMMGHMGMGKWWKDSDTVKQLQLNDGQVQQIEQGFLNHRMRLVDLHAALEKQEIQLHNLIDADQLDESQINAQLEQVVAARANLERENAAMMLNIRHVLSLDQWKKLQSLHGGMPGMFMHRPNGPGEAPLPPPPSGPGGEN